MIISDLNHVEVVSEETETRIVGGAVFTYSSSSYSSSSNKPSMTFVSTLPFAGAKGPAFTYAATSTSTQSGPGGSSIVSMLTNVSYWK